MPTNRLRHHRELAGLSQIDLAARVRLTRQSIGAIEAGRATPAVDVALRLAAALGCSVEHLFASEEVVPVELLAPRSGPRIGLARLGERWVGVPARLGPSSAAEALIQGDTGTTTATPLRPLQEAEQNLLVLGCALGLGVLAGRQRGPGRLLWHPCSSAAALRALGRGLAHVAGVHHPTGPGADPNAAAVRRARLPFPTTLVTLAVWEAGLLSRAGDDRVRHPSDLAAPELRLASREAGAGARALLEQHLAAANGRLDRLDMLVCGGHLEVAHAVALGAADAGVATRDAAEALGLRFLPLRQERYDLVIPSASLADPRVLRLLDLLTSAPARAELGSLGYDTARSGAAAAAVDAA